MGDWRVGMLVDIAKVDVVEGIVSGVAAGVVLAVFFWVIDQVKRHSERREQIQYLVTLIASHRERIYKPHYMPGDPVMTDIGKDVIRKVQFESMKKEINVSLDGRCSRLSFDEINKLRRIVNDWSAITDKWDSTEPNWTDKFCGNLFGEFEAIEWLDLPKGPDFFASSKQDGGDSQTR